MWESEVGVLGCGRLTREGLGRGLGCGGLGWGGWGVGDWDVGDWGVGDWGVGTGV